MNRAQLQSHQLVLKFLGFYTGKCDGIWGPDSVAAMRKYESSGKFAPGYPSNGMPFKPNGQLPTGLYRVPRQPMMIKHVDMPEGYEKQFVSELVAVTLSRSPCGKVIDCAKKAVHTIQEPVKNETAEVKETKPVETVRHSKLPG